jgi:hypothetical integral membrane protein (TIGR02206 family)
MPAAMPTTATSTTADALRTFAPWSASHWAAIAAAVGVAAALSATRRGLRDTPDAGRRLDRGFALLAAVAWAATQALQLALDGFPSGTSLPLHVSDLTALAVPLALWTCRRWLRAVVYYWGLTLASLAFLLPDLHDGPARLGYWLFWGAHVIILAAVPYDVVGRGFHPGWRDFRSAAYTSLLYAALIIPFNVAAGQSYGYLGPPRGGEPAVLRYFGPWPLRVLPVVGCGLAGMALLTLPWEVSRRRRHRHATSEASLTL